MKDAEWLKWLTVDECIELHMLNVIVKTQEGRQFVRRVRDRFRQVAVHRRKRNSRRFAIYQEAMHVHGD